MSRSALDQLLFMMDCAFEGDASQPDRSWHALLVNLASVDSADWGWTPIGGRRTIRQLVREVGVVKYVCDSHAFGDASIHWSVPDSIPALDPDASPDEVIGWLRKAHQQLRDDVAALENDAALLETRPSYLGEDLPIQWQINTMIQHDIYHAGEINHIRALRQDND